MNKNGNIILSSLTEVEKQAQNIEKCKPGYIEVKLSTKGKVGAPKVFHVRNFKVSDIIALSMSDRTELPLRLVSILNEMIYEDVDVAKWHEKEVEELMVYIFLTFYKGVLEDIPYPMDESDYEYLRKTEDGEKKIEDIKSGKWIPRTSINIAEDTDTYDIADDFSPRIPITVKKTGFKVTFDYIKYGDQIIIKNWLNSYFAKDESKFARIRREMEINNDLSSQFLDNPSVLDKYITIDKNEENEYKEYLVRRTQAITDMAHIVSIVDFDGEDVSHLSISEKYEKIAGDARIDYNLIAYLSKKQAKAPFGIKPTVRMRNPFTGGMVEKPFSFRIPLILQSLQVSRDDEYDDSAYDEGEYNLD